MAKHDFRTRRFKRLVRLSQPGQPPLSARFPRFVSDTATAPSICRSEAGNRVINKKSKRRAVNADGVRRRKLRGASIRLAAACGLAVMILACTTKTAGVSILPPLPTASLVAVPLASTPEPASVPVVPTTTAPPPTSTSNDWRGYVAVWFRPEHVELVLQLVACESSGRADAVNPNKAANGMTAKGLLQHLDGYWSSRSRSANEAGYRNTGDIFNPFDQLAVSAWLAYNTPQGFNHWECHEL